MNADFNNYKHTHLTDQIIKAFYTVYNKLGYGFLEKVYVNALLIELKKMGIPAEAQYAIKVYYDGNVVGEYFADILVDRLVIVEAKAAKTIASDHEAQLLNYLKATDIEVGLLLNFGPKAEFKVRLLKIPGSSL
jgi:GxxExxY protein